MSINSINNDDFFEQLSPIEPEVLKDLGEQLPPPKRVHDKEGSAPDLPSPQVKRHKAIDSSSAEKWQKAKPWTPQEAQKRVTEFQAQYDTWIFAVRSYICDNVNEEETNKKNPLPPKLKKPTFGANWTKLVLQKKITKENFAKGLKCFSADLEKMRNTEFLFPDSWKESQVYPPKFKARFKRLTFLLEAASSQKIQGDSESFTVAMTIGDSTETATAHWKNIITALYKEKDPFAALWQAVCFNSRLTATFTTAVAKDSAKKSQ